MVDESCHAQFSLLGIHSRAEPGLRVQAFIPNFLHVQPCRFGHTGYAQTSRTGGRAKHNAKRSAHLRSQYPLRTASIPPSPPPPPSPPRDDRPHRGDPDWGKDGHVASLSVWLCVTLVMSPHCASARSKRSSSTEPPKKKRILILMSDTGGGHRASAQALQDALENAYGAELECKIVDMFCEIAGAPFSAMPAGYSWVAKRPWLWRAMFTSGRIAPFRFVTERVSYFMMRARLLHAFRELRPDLIVSVHPLCVTGPLRALRELGQRERVKFATVVTDLGGAHPVWFDAGVDACFVPNASVASLARRRGLRDEQLHEVGLPVRAAFSRDPPRARSQMRHALGLSPNSPAVLLMGGGDGVGGLGRVASQVATALANAHSAGKVPHAPQMVVICGRNEALRRELLAAEWPIKVQVHGFVSNVSDWMAACDTLITKAGPGSIAESMIRGLPVVLSGYLPGQEFANVELVESERVGVYRRKPDEIARVTADLLSDPLKLSEMSQRARMLGRPHATQQIAAKLHSMLDNAN